MLVMAGTRSSNTNTNTIEHEQPANVIRHQAAYCTSDDQTFTGINPTTTSYDNVEGQQLSGAHSKVPQVFNQPNKLSSERPCVEHTDQQAESYTQDLSVVKRQLHLNHRWLENGQFCLF